RLFGMVQGKANQWIHVLLPALLAALRALGDAPARSLSALAQRLGVAEAAAATMVTPLEEESAPVVAVPTATPAAPLLPMTAPSGASSAPKTLLNGRVPAGCGYCFGISPKPSERGQSAGHHHSKPVFTTPSMSLGLSLRTRSPSTPRSATS